MTKARSQIVRIDAVVVGELEGEVLVLGAVAKEGVGVLLLGWMGEVLFLGFLMLGFRR